MQRANFLLSILLCMSPNLQEQSGSSVVHGEVVEVDVGQATDHVADVLFIVDTSSSVGENYEKMRKSFIRLMSNFKIGDDNLRIAVVECHGENEEQEELTLLLLKQGNSKDAVNQALEKLQTVDGNPFPACFRAASNHIFKKENGDRPDAPNIIIFISDAEFSDIKKHGDPTEEVESLKQNNVTILAISFCKTNECEQTILNNNKIASMPEYSIKMKNFNANNLKIRNALQRSASCKQKVELAECAWVGNSACERSITPEEHFSNKICEKNANKTNLITQASAEDCKSCANVNKITRSCVLDKKQKCRVRNFEVEHRAKNQFDVARSGDPIAEDLEACGSTEPKGDACPESICQAADCKFGNNFNVESCGNVHLQILCAKELKARCQGSDDIDVHCYAFYFARNKKSFIAEMQVTWTNGIPVVTKVEKNLKDLCENNTLRLNCSKWMKDRFDANPKNICSKVGSTIAVECLEDPASAACSNNTGDFTIEQACDELCNTKDPKIYIPCIEEKQKRWNNHNTAPYPCKKHIADLKNGPGSDVEKSSSKGLAIGVSIALLILVILALVIAVFLVRRKKKKASRQTHISVPTKHAGAKSVGLSTNLDETSRVGNSRSRTTKSAVSAKSKTTKSAASKSKTAKSRTLTASKPKVGKHSGKNGSKIAKFDSIAEGKVPALKKGNIKSSRILKAKK